MEEHHDGTAKMDVKSRARLRIATTKDQVSARLEEAGPAAPASVSATVLVTVVLAIVWRRLR